MTETLEALGDESRHCFWMLDAGGASRPCANSATRRYGSMVFCHHHERQFFTAVLAAVVVDRHFASQLVRGIVDTEVDEAEVWRQHRKKIGPWPPEGRAHCVYFAEREGFVKIGRTANLQKRLHQIGGGSCMPQGMSVGPVRPLGVIYCACDGRTCVRESYFHQKFRDKHLEGEWFIFDDELAAFIGGLKVCLDEQLRTCSEPSQAVGTTEQGVA